MTSALDLPALLSVEDDRTVLDFACRHTGLLAWPQVRVMFLRLMLSDLVYGQEVTGQSSTRAPRSLQFATLGRSLWRNARFRATGRVRAKIGIMAKAAANQWTGGLWFNRLADHFVLAHPGHSLVVEDQFQWNWPFPRVHSRLMMHAPQQALAVVGGRVLARTSHRAQAKTLLDLVAARAETNLGWVPSKERQAALADTLARKLAALPLQFAAYSRLFRRMQPDVLLVEDASYGPASPMIAAARSRGIPVAEYQHGAVSPGHDGYNFAPALRESEALRRGLPDVFLAYGEWWNEQINLPVARIALGNPHREETLRRRAPTCGEARDVLILSDGIDFEAYARLARAVAPAAIKRGWRVVLRPHPLERSAVQQRHGERMGEVAIDRNADLYASFDTARAVISELSTGLFEAVGLVPRLCLWDTPKARFVYPSHPFDAFADVAGLLDLLERPNGGMIDAGLARRIWQPGWRANYDDFLRGYGLELASPPSPTGSAS